jgi:hypothetical protein
VAGEALYLEGRVEDLLGALVAVDELDDLARLPRVLLPRNVTAVLALRQHVAQRRADGLVRDELGELVRVGVRVLEDAPGVPDGGLGADGAEGDDLGYVLVPAVLVRNVLHHLRAPETEKSMSTSGMLIRSGFRNRSKSSE